MKSLTTAAAIQCAGTYNEPVLLLEIEWSDSETGRYAERAVSVDSASYDGNIVQFGPIGSFFGNPASELNPISVELFPDDALRNKVAVVSPEGKPARIKLFFVGTEATDMVELFSGYVARIDFLNPDSVELTLTGFFVKYNRMLPCDILSLDDFPNANHDHIANPLPLVYGNVPRLPTLGVKTGGLTCLHGSILSNDTTIEVDDTTGFPSSGTFLIEEEQITYTGISGNTFTGCTRGANGTDAAEHLNRREVIEYMTDHIYLVAGHACKAVGNVRVAGIPVDGGGCTIDKNNTQLLPGATLTTITFTNRPRVLRCSRASRFLEMQFDETAQGNEAVNPSYCYDTTLEGFATLVAKISGSFDNDTLRIKQTTDVSGYGSKYGEILKTFLMVEHFESETFDDDYLSAAIAGQSYNLAKPGEEDTAGGGGEVDIDHGHTHVVTGEHTHTMTVKKMPIFTNSIVQSGGTTGAWSELDDIAGDNLNKSGFTTTTDTDRNLLCYVRTTTTKGAVQKIQFCCRRGESGMTGSFYLRFYLNGTLKKTYTVSGTSSPQTWKSGWETIDGLDWDDLDASNTYIAIIPVGGALIRLFGVWFELEYLEQPDTYEGDGVKDSDDVNDYTDDNAHVINEQPISSTSVVEGVDITDLVAQDWSWFNNREVQIDYNVVSSDDGVNAYLLHVWFEIEYAPFEEIISDEVTCDVQGIETDGDGTGTLIENPADVIKHILVALLGLDENTYIDTDSFATAEQSLDAAGAAFAFALYERMKASTLLHALADQGRSRLKFDSGKFSLTYRSDSLGQPSRVIMPSALCAGSPCVRHAALGSVVNKLIGYHTRDYSKRGRLTDKDPAFSVAEDSQSQTDYGLRESRRELFAVRDADYAGDLLDFVVTRAAAPACRYHWISFLRDVDLEQGDIVELCDVSAYLLKARAEIVEASFLPGSGVEKRLDSVSFAAEVEPYALYWSVPGGTYIRLAGDAFHFVVRNELVARLTGDGVFFIKGFVITDVTLPAASANPLSYDPERKCIAFALSNDTRVIELDEAGNMLLPGYAATDQTLSFAGEQDEIDSDASTVWVNIGSSRVLEAAASVMKLAGYVVTDCDWEALYG